MSGGTDVDMLYPTDKPAYAARIKTNPMNIIRPLSVLFLYLLATSLSHATLTPIGPLDFASGATVIDFSGLADGTEANGLVVNGVLFQVTKNGSSTNGIVSVDGGPGTTEILRHRTWSRLYLQMVLP